MRIANSNLDARQDGERKAVLLKALQAIESLQSKLDAIEHDLVEPIAIVGLSCRFPGSNDPDAFWSLLAKGVDAVSEAPKDRWEKGAYIDSDLSTPGKLRTLYGGFLDHIDLFDPAFFGISGREAESMDPQQRLLLEVSWEALENAGIATTRLRGSQTGVFVGITTSDYARLAVANNSIDLDIYTATGGALNVAAGRLSHVLGLNGPAMAVDTACSSSLVAVHLACQSLRARECNLALAGGVNVLLTPEPFICFAKWGMMAPDGSCKTFDERADGFVRGEGCGVIALKRLSDAVAMGDRVVAVIRGTAVNQDGASSGLTVPNGLAQQAVVRKALAAAHVRPEDVDYIEAHGTGTTLGDPIELEALAAVLGQNRPTDRPLRVGSVKTNLGHLESASGIAGLIKVILSMGHEEIPPQLHFHKLNPRISLGSAPIEIPVNSVPWPRSERPRIAGVSSFGFSGTNAHVVLQEGPAAKEPPTQSRDRSTHLMVLSASSETALRELSAAYAERLTKEQEGSFPDICYTAAIGRTALPHRLAFPSPNISDARELLSISAQGKPNSEIVSGCARSDARVAFLFTGQGAQKTGLGRDLYESEAVFRDAFDRCALLLDQHLDRSLRVIVGYSADGSKPSGRLVETGYAQTALFAVEYSLASLWRSWGIEPAAIVGHGLGEYVGACVAGIVTLEEALRLVAKRSLLMQSLPRQGAMAAIFAGEDQVRAGIALYTDSVAIAATNSPLNTVISGKSEDVRAVLEQLSREGIESRYLPVSHAFHSPLIEPILDEFENYARTVKYDVPVVDLISNLTGNPVDETLPLDASYWRRHTRETVRFAESIGHLYARGIRIFLEIGAAPVLIGMGRQCVEDPETAWLASVGKDKSDCSRMLSSLGALFVLGAKPDWETYDKAYRRRRVSLPTYPFQRERHWLPVASASSARSPVRGTGHPLLGTHVPLAGRPGEHVWYGEVSLERYPWIDEHRVQGMAMVPATAFIEMAIAAAVETVSELPVILTRIEIEKVLLLKPGMEFEIQTRLEPQVAETMLFQVHSRRKDSDGDWTLHASGSLRVSGVVIPEEKFSVSQRDAFEQRSTCSFDGPEFYRLQNVRGNQWGPCFQGLKRAWQGQGEALGEVGIAAGIQREFSRYVFHPAFSDSLGHILTATIPLEKSGEKREGAFVGAGIEEIRVYRRPEGERFYAYARLRSSEDTPENTLVGDVKVFDFSGNLITETLGARLWLMGATGENKALESVEDWLYEPKWIAQRSADGISTRLSTAGTWIILRDQIGIGDALCRQVRERGVTCLYVDHGDHLSQPHDGSMTIRPDNPSDYDGMLRAAAGQGPMVEKIVHLWNLDNPDPEKIDLRALHEAQTAGMISVLHLVQALDRAQQPAPPKLCLITRGAQPVGDKAAPLSLLQSPVWGLGRSIAMESGEFWGGQVDLDPADTPEAAAAVLLGQLINGKGEDQTAFREGCRHVFRLTRRAKTGSKPKRLPIRTDAAYLITGGLGGVGLIIAQWLANHGARHLILAGRSSFTVREKWDGVARDTGEGVRITAVRNLESMGVNVQTPTVDMGDGASVNELLRQCLRISEPPLRGVFHAAGVVESELLVNQSPEQMRDILSGKMAGGWLLHRLLADVPLEMFVLFSSFSSLLTLPTMGSYAAANVFLDALAHHRRATGKVALSVNWGPWAEAGMAARFLAGQESKRDRRTTSNNGVGVLATPRALEALEHLIEDGAVQTGVIEIDWGAWKKWSYGDLATPSYLSLLIPDKNSGMPAKTSNGLNRELIETAQPGNRMELVGNYLTEQMSRILRIPLASVNREKPIVNMGFDSLMSIELKNQIEVDLGVSVAMARLIQGPTLSELTNWVVNLLGTAQPAGNTSAVTSSAVEFEEGVL